MKKNYDIKDVEQKIWDSEDNGYELKYFNRLMENIMLSEF